MILFVQTAFLGDLLLSIPTLRALKVQYPDKKIHLVCRKGLGKVLLHLGVVDEVFDQFKKTKPSLQEWRALFKNRSYDLLICPHESLRSKWMSALVKAKKKIGYRSVLGSFVFDTTEERPMQWPEALRQLFLIRALAPELAQRFLELPKVFQIFHTIPDWASMNLYSLKEKREAREKFFSDYNLDTQKPLIAIAPGSVWPTKRWTSEGFTEVAKHFIDKQHQVVIIGSPDEKSIADAIAEKVPRALNLCGKTVLTELTSVLAACDLLIGNDSGSMHLAAVVGTPAVSIFGPTILEFGYQPWMDHFQLIEERGLKCRPCSSHGGKVCPIGTHECMKMIHSSRIISASETLLAIK